MKFQVDRRGDDRVRQVRRTGPDHVGDVARDLLDLVIEFIQNLVVLGAIVAFVQRLDITLGLLLEPIISIGDITD